MKSDYADVAKENAAKLLAKVAARRLPPPEERRHIREKVGLTRAEMAEALGVDAVSILRWEHGAVPRRGHVEAYARLLEELDRADS